MRTNDAGLRAVRFLRAPDAPPPQPVDGDFYPSRRAMASPTVTLTRADVAWIAFAGALCGVLAGMLIVAASGGSW